LSQATESEGVLQLLAQSTDNGKHIFVLSKDCVVVIPDQRDPMLPLWLELKNGGLHARETLDKSLSVACSEAPHLPLFPPGAMFSHNIDAALQQLISVLFSMGGD
jgi:hypothetical protein